MNGGRDPLNWTLSDGLAETVSAESCHIVLETSPPDYVRKISRYLEESVAQTGEDQTSRDSDSGDSLFLTQKFVTEPVRPRRQRRSTLWSDPASPRDLEDSEDENDPERRRKKGRLPKYSFPFLKERKWKPRSTQLCVAQNAELHNCGMGGFFKCVRELSQRRRRGDDLGSLLPTVDVDGEEISPLLESAEEWSENEDIRVVERKCLVVSSKPKRPGPWNTPKKRHEWVKEQRKEVCNTGQETAPGRTRKQARASTSKVLWTPGVESTGDGDPSSRAQKDSGRSEELIKSHRNITAQTETPEMESRSQDLPQSPPHLERDDTNGNESQVEKEKEKGEHGGEGNLPDTATSENLDAADAESPAPQVSDELESNEKNLMEKTPLGQEETGEIAPMKHKKKKNRKNKPEVENSGQEDGSGDLECDTRTEDNRKVKKKRKKRKDELEEEAEHFSSNAAAETLNSDAEIRRKRKKEKSFINTEDATNSALDQLEEPESCLENPTASQETSDSSNRKSKKHKKKKSHHDAAQVGEEEEEDGGGDVSTSNDAATRPGKKKKKKKKTGFSISDGTDLSDQTQKTTGDGDAEPVTKKKKKKKKLGEITADAVEQSHDSVSAQWVEEGTSSFLAADAEGKDESAAPQPAAVSAGDPTAEWTEMAGGVKKKKRKRNHEEGFDKPSETCRSDPHESTNAGEKRKKKRRQDDGEPVTPVERLEITADEEQLQTDEAVVLKKKKKKKKNRTEENPTTVTEDAESVLSTSHKDKLETSDMASSDVPGNLTLSHFKDKKKKMKKTDNGYPEGESLATRVELEPKKHKKKERIDPTAASGFISNKSTLSETDSASYAADEMKKNKHKKAKRRLHNSSEDFLTSC